VHEKKESNVNAANAIGLSMRFFNPFAGGEAFLSVSL